MSSRSSGFADRARVLRRRLSRDPRPAAAPATPAEATPERRNSIAAALANDDPSAAHPGPASVSRNSVGVRSRRSKPESVEARLDHLLGNLHRLGEFLDGQAHLDPRRRSSSSS